MNTLEQYLRNEAPKGEDFVVRVKQTGDVVSFYIRPSNRDGETADFIVFENEVAPDPATTQHP